MQHFIKFLIMGGFVLITRLIARDFGVYRSIDLPIDRVTSFCGLNASGKSTIREMLEVILYDSNAREQGSFIRSVGEEIADSFYVEIQFSDGISISKEKFRQGGSEWKMCKGSEVVYTNRNNNALISIQGVPEAIQKYLGVVIDPHTKEKLNSRKKQDKLFLIDTTGGDNYKILNAILKEEKIAAASVNINKDRNRKDSDIVTLYTKKETIQKTKDSLNIIKQEYLEQLSKINDVINKDRNLIQILDKEIQKNQIKVSPELSRVDAREYVLLKGIQEKLQGLNSIKKTITPEFSTLDTGKLKGLIYIQGLLDNLSNLKIQPEVQGVSNKEISKIDNLNKFTVMVSKLEKLIQGYAEVESDLQDVENSLHKLQKEHDLVLCPTCSTVIEAGEQLHSH
jgi:hypothetical protein